MEPPAKQTARIPWQRRLFRFSLRRLLLFVLLCSIYLGWPHIWRLIQFQRLKSYAGQDLRQLSETESEEFARIARTVLADPKPVEPMLRFFYPQPWYVWQTATDDGEPLTILFQAAHSRRQFLVQPGRPGGDCRERSGIARIVLPFA